MKMKVMKRLRLVILLGLLGSAFTLNGLAQPVRLTTTIMPAAISVAIVDPEAFDQDKPRERPVEKPKDERRDPPRDERRNDKKDERKKP